MQRLLAEKPNATGLAVPGMPIGSLGMEGGTPEPYEVVLFGPAALIHIALTEPRSFVSLLGAANEVARLSG